MQDWLKLCVNTVIEVWELALDKLADVVMPKEFGKSEHVKDKQGRLF